ncbi:transposase [Streptomyces griseus]|uniref:transposase n=1 Tax=Streptomyces griseus TaxID=1911 RepID=UPI000B2EFC21|nr:transposase [Streptomyces griseus]SQA21902.1 IS110 family transposase [Streptomyces griseus]
MVQPDGGLLARRIKHLTEEIDDLNKQIAKAVEASRPGLLEVRGVGPDSAAALLISAGDNPERLASEASFAALCGTSPVEASSGKTQRRRLNRGATARRTPPSTASSSADCAGMVAPVTTCNDGWPRARHDARSSAASNATSHEKSID